MDKEYTLDQFQFLFFRKKGGKEVFLLKKWKKTKLQTKCFEN